ncbi:hypothetical protein [Hyphomicrobium sp.]|uniref:hypothetical protein n=1 Tax=Hyphomicrobium sp. TaxID=82 RepID=UPI002D78E5DB|nr:hypothetical protein [Hyphomicrobium sp.]HET6388452.1 hypothetical protein [Hyphomicrobium sp.]
MAAACSQRLEDLSEVVMPGKCPKCQNIVGTARAEQMNIANGMGKVFAGASYNCPHCQTILGVSVDPFAFKNEIALELMRRMRGGR